MNHEIFQWYRQEEGVQTICQYDQLDAIACVRASAIYNGLKGYSLDFYVSSPGTDVWPAIIQINVKSLVDVRHVVRDVRNKIRYDLAPRIKEENF